MTPVGATTAAADNAAEPDGRSEGWGGAEGGPTSIIGVGEASLLFGIGGLVVAMAKVGVAKVGVARGICV